MSAPTCGRSAPAGRAKGEREVSVTARTHKHTHYQSQQLLHSCYHNRSRKRADMSELIFGWLGEERIPLVSVWIIWILFLKHSLAHNVSKACCSLTWSHPRMIMGDISITPLRWARSRGDAVASGGCHKKNRERSYARRWMRGARLIASDFMLDRLSFLRFWSEQGV